MSTWYATEGFTDDERTILATHFTSLESPVFALIGLPEAVMYTTLGLMRAATVS